MYAIANTTISIQRGDTTDPYGDDIDQPQTIASGIPALLAEVSKRVTTPDNPTPRIVRVLAGTVGSWVDIQDGDRVIDERTSRTYPVMGVTQRALPGLIADKDFELRLTN